eukprot:3075312-Prymnesium_polylepis.1
MAGTTPSSFDGFLPPSAPYMLQRWEAVTWVSAAVGSPAAAAGCRSANNRVIGPLRYLNVFPEPV